MGYTHTHLEAKEDDLDHLRRGSKLVYRKIGEGNGYGIRLPCMLYLNELS